VSDVSIRRATEDDLDFIVGLLSQDDVEPFLAASRARDADSVREELRASEEAPDERGIFIIEVHEGRAGMMEFSLSNRRSRIAHLGGLAIHPDFRGRRLADEAARQFQRHLIFDLGFHRLQLQCWPQQRSWLRPLRARATP
jgi:RimJ/RimL family protein N-acetyltransferase